MWQGARLGTGAKMTSGGCCFVCLVAEKWHSLVIEQCVHSTESRTVRILICISNHNLFRTLRQFGLLCTLLFCVISRPKTWAATINLPVRMHLIWECIWSIHACSWLSHFLTFRPSHLEQSPQRHQFTVLNCIRPVLTSPCYSLFFQKTEFWVIGIDDYKLITMIMMLCADG